MAKIHKIKFSELQETSRINPTKIIGEQLVALRKTAGLTQAQITAKSALTPTRVVDIEQGRTNYTIESLATYLIAIGKDFSDLTLKGNEDK